MDMVTHIINMNNRSKSSHWYLIDKGEGKIVAKNTKAPSKTFQSYEEFLGWFKSYAIHTIENRLLLR